MRDNILRIDTYMEPEGQEIEASEVPPGQSWNFQVTQVYGARNLKLCKEGQESPIHLDGRNVKIGVIDTGIDDTNPDLKGRVRGGINYATKDRGDIKDYYGHGSWVAGLISGKNEHRGVVSETELYSIKVEERRGQGKAMDIERGVYWAMDHNIDIIVIPHSVEGELVGLKEACGEARKKGIVVIASAGNYICSARWPAGWPKEYAISIGSIELKTNTEKKEIFTAEDTEHNMFSNKWPYIDYVAPGRNIIAAWLGDKYYRGSGTSIAAPHVAGILAMGLSVARQIKADVTLQELETILGETAFKYDDVGSHLWANYWKEFIDPQGKVFYDNVGMINAMFGSGLVQAKEFIIKLCQHINSRSEKGKIFID